MKNFILIFLLFVTINHLPAQPGNIDSLKRELEINQNDTLKLFHFILLAEAYEETKTDSSFYYAKNQRCWHGIYSCFWYAQARDACAKREN